jgi:DNA topoisomerase-2
MIEQKFKKLTDLEHVLLRPGRYIGSINPHTSDSYVLEDSKFKKKELTWNPAFIKIFDEIISNSVDFSKTAEGSHLNTIKVNVDRDTGTISVEDNGGIVVAIHKEHQQYIPEMIFELKSGSNFDDDSDDFLTGQNGEGSALTNIFSNQFIVNTADGKLEFTQTHSNNSKDKTEPVVKKSTKKFTKITYDTDFVRFGMNGIDSDNYNKLVKRVYDVAACNSKLKIYLNEERIEIKSFEDYIKLYTDDYIFEQNENWQIGVSKSDGSFSHVSFVNNTETYIGGNHVGYISDQIVNKLRTYITKKHKIDIKPSEIKNHINLFINCNIVRPRYSSQTKEDLINEPKTFGTSFVVSDKFIKKIIESSIVQSILDWAEAKENALKNAELRKLNKSVDKLNPARVDKFEDANEKKDRSKCILFLTEGNSASSAIMSARDPELHGVFSLKGKPLNVTDIDAKKLMENTEFKSILTIMGLKLGEQVTPMSPLRFGKMCFLTDADCITEEHYVLTDKGEKLISDVNPLEDNVLTHLNEYKPVEYVNMKSTDTVIRITSGEDIIEGTPEHKHVIWRDGKIIKVMFKDIKSTDKILKKKS